MTLGGCAGASIAVSRSGSDDTTCAALVVPSANVTWMAVAPSTTWAAVMTCPSRLTTMPLPSDDVPSASAAITATSDGWMVRKTRSATGGATVVVVGPAVVGGAARSESEEPA